MLPLSSAPDDYSNQPLVAPQAGTPACGRGRSRATRTFQAIGTGAESPRPVHDSLIDGFGVQPTGPPARSGAVAQIHLVGLVDEIGASLAVLLLVTYAPAIPMSLVNLFYR